ncbi:MAG: zinc ABC transporter substrate-binding protein [Dehalococcoidia bacterium]|uniref:metal ABC transporter substrate-binding protein n=1 Tax=Candidatus Amarobacter glycogenicus TaxID=3140699 RepID=UPI0031361693|nr:zinc ABC transporter substrate-binding protein [Dehalococcoidia bacterium]
MSLLARLSALIVFIFAVVAASACGGSGPETTGAGIQVVATTTQIGALTQAVAGEGVALTVLLSAGADAHDYEPSPLAAKKIAAARVILRNGLGLDDWLDSTIEGSGTKGTVVTVTDGIDLRVGDGEADPHVWHSPANAKVDGRQHCHGSQRSRPGTRISVRPERDAYKKTLDETDAEIRRLIDQIPSENRRVVTNHDALGYFFDRYGIVFIGAIIPTASKDAQPSAKELAELQNLIETQGVKAILAEQEVDPKVARELAEDTGVRIVEGLYADSLGEKGSGAETVDGCSLPCTQDRGRHCDNGEIQAPGSASGGPALEIAGLSVAMGRTRR